VPVGAPGTGLVYYTSSISQTDNQYVARVDHNVGDKLRLYGSYLWDGLHAPSTTIPNNVLTATADQAWTSQNFVLNATYTFRPNLLATFVGSLSRRSNLYTGPTGFPDCDTRRNRAGNLSRKPWSEFPDRRGGNTSAH